MKTIKVCIGSACHIKGSYEVIEIFKELIEEYKLQTKVELCGSFCLGKCRDAVSVMRWDEKIFSISKENAREMFKNEFISYL
ncbi:(2Fe-2S) ferredoxin domain-containing protein [Romboutsia sp.]|uniref:(2Fe-2S) ferredoxin domain-containing protein n=1 Tax=Romboutsia sp. TaxID=1965302 RepID=UPI002BDB3C51|nr:(2Fe-2S) ferredoxin domain-containing protein [Romboutsia sp.]HSQ88474.1 (2Fe-2S) ferredoxin domain-containing protein [Romboutsia sp.]